MEIVINAVVLANVLKYTRTLFMTKNSTISLKLNKGSNNLILKKNEQCNGKFLVARVPFTGFAPEETYQFVIDEKQAYEAVYGNKGLITLTFEARSVTIGSTKIPNLASHFSYVDALIPTDAKVLHKGEFLLTPEMKQYFQQGLPFVRAMDTGCYVRAYDGVMYAQKLDNGRCNLYSTDGGMALVQHTKLDLPTTIIPNDFIKVLLASSSSSFNPTKVLLSMYEVTDKHLEERNFPFERYIYSFTVGNITIYHTRRLNDYVPFEIIDYGVDDAEMVVSITVERLFQIIEGNITDHLVIDFSKFHKDPGVTDVYRAKEGPKKLAYDVALFRKALEHLKTGTVTMMYKDNSPIVLYNENNTIYIMNLRRVE